jgi:hypothetical protein
MHHSLDLLFSVKKKNHPITQMEKLVQQQCDMELMKAAMLKHEEAFQAAGRWTETSTILLPILGFVRQLTKFLS